MSQELAQMVWLNDRIDLINAHIKWKEKLANIQKPNKRTMRAFESQVNNFKSSFPEEAGDATTEWLIDFVEHEKEIEEMRRKRKRVKYLGYSGSKFSKVKWYSVSISNESVKVYYDALKILARLPGYARTVLDVILLEMDKGNYIRNYKPFKAKVCDVSPMSSKTINKAFSVLKDHDILLKTDKKAQYYVNPLFFLREPSATGTK